MTTKNDMAHQAHHPGFDLPKQGMLLLDLPLDVLKYHIFSQLSGLDPASIQLCRFVCKRLSTIIPRKPVKFHDTVARLGYVKLMKWAFNNHGVYPGPKTLACAMSGAHTQVCEWLVTHPIVMPRKRDEVVYGHPFPSKTGFLRETEAYSYSDMSEFDPSALPIRPDDDTRRNTAYDRVSMVVDTVTFNKDIRRLDVMETIVFHDLRVRSVAIRFNGAVQSFLIGQTRKLRLFIPMFYAVYTDITIDQFLPDGKEVEHGTIMVIGGYSQHIPRNGCGDFSSKVSEKAHSPYTGGYTRPLIVKSPQGCLVWYTAKERDLL